VSQATEIYSREFDAVFFRLPPQVQRRIEARLRQLGQRLDDFPHVRLQGRSEFRLRVGDYRIIYVFDVSRNELSLVTLGNRREVSHLLTRERGFAGWEELSWAGFGSQGVVTEGKSILCRKCNCLCFRPGPRI
jgi:mRNA-degrading endonuclease RelE of RelBE toxin-antitoxin system